MVNIGNARVLYQDLLSLKEVYWWLKLLLFFVLFDRIFTIKQYVKKSAWEQHGENLDEGRF